MQVIKFWTISLLSMIIFIACKTNKLLNRELVIYPDPTAILVPDSLKHLIPILDSVWYRDQFYRYDLKTISLKDQRKEFERNAAKVREWDAKNLAIVEEIIQKYGWLGPRDIGFRGVSALFLPIQHADLKTQEKYMPVIKQAAIDKKVIPSHYAMFADRVEIRNKRPQVYGTQINAAGGVYEILPLLNPDSVDVWRKSINMAETMEEYIKRWNLKWDKDTYKKQLPALKKKYGIHY